MKTLAHYAHPMDFEDIGAFTYNNELIRCEVSETFLCSGDDKLVSLRLKTGTPVSRLSQ